MTTQLQAVVLGSEGNLWLETAPFGNIIQTLTTRQQIDANVSNLYSQVGERRIWRTAFQALNAGEVFVCGNDGNLWLEHAPFDRVPPSRIPIDSNVETFQAMDLGTVFVLGIDSNLWLENAPFGNIPPARTQIDARVLAFQVLDSETIFVLGTDYNLWLEQAPFGKKIPPSRQQIDANVVQFWAMDQGTVYVLGSDLNLWYEPGPFGDVSKTIANRSLIASNVNDFQPLRSATDGGESHSGSSADTVFVLRHDAKLWLVQGPYAGIAHTNQTQQFVSDNVIAFGAADPSTLFLIDGNLNLWQKFSPFGPQNSTPVDKNVIACQPLFPAPRLFAQQRPIHRSQTH